MMPSFHIPTTAFREKFRLQSSTFLLNSNKPSGFFFFFFFWTGFQARQGFNPARLTTLPFGDYIFLPPQKNDPLSAIPNQQFRDYTCIASNKTAYSFPLFFLSLHRQLLSSRPPKENPSHHHIIYIFLFFSLSVKKITIFLISIPSPESQLPPPPNKKTETKICLQHLNPKAGLRP